jgi:hypothetical protein
MARMKTTTSGLVAVALLIPTLALAVWLPRKTALELLALFLTFIGGIYGGFALLDKRKREFVLESVGLLITFAFAAAGLWVSPVYLAAGYIFHGAWDALHHPKGIQTVIPPGYAPFCMIFDLPVGAFILFWWR